VQAELHFFVSAGDPGGFLAHETLGVRILVNGRDSNEPMRDIGTYGTYGIALIVFGVILTILLGLLGIILIIVGIVLLVVGLRPSPADRFCPSCGAGASNTDTYCSKCGKPLPPST
jgi:hypothetical protein